MEEKIPTLLSVFLNQISEIHEYFVTYGHVSYPCQCVFKRVFGFKIQLLSSLPSPKQSPSQPSSDNLLFEVD